MSLFPAYGTQGGGGGRGGGRRSREDREGAPKKDIPSTTTSNKNVRGEDLNLFMIDRSGDGGAGTSSDPILICGGDEDEDEEGEVRDDQSSRHSSSGNKKRKKRKRSRSRSPNNKKKKHKKQQTRSPRREDTNQQYDRPVAGHHNYDQRGRGYEPRRQGGSSRGAYNNLYEMGRNGGNNYGNSDGRGPAGHGRMDYYGNQYPVEYGNVSRQQYGGPTTTAYGYEHEQDRHNRIRPPHSDRDNRERDAYYEQQRVNTAQNFPRKVFLEEVNLKPEFAFRVDTEANHRNLNSYSLSNMQKSVFHYNNSVKVMGASDKELTQIYNKFSKFRCILPDGRSESANNASDEFATKELRPALRRRPKPSVETQTFIGIPDTTYEQQRNSDDRIDTYGALESGPRKEEVSMKERIESYNKRVRDEPTNIALWKEFIEFQDKYFQENEHVYAEGGKDNKKKKSSKKALFEKKVAICEKALEKNPKNLEINLMRLNFLYAFQQPDLVLNELKKLVSGSPQVTSYWMEYFRFASTELQIFSTQRVSELIQTSIRKFRHMLTPKFPEFQRPLKLHLVMNDILMCLSLILRNSGHREKAIALHQAQLEADFYPPLARLKGASLLDWNENKTMFENFWDIGTEVIGENESSGWCNCIEDVEKQLVKHLIGISDAQVSKIEDLFFETVNVLKTGPIDKSRCWLQMESWRCKFQWLRWRPKCSDVSEIHDNNRVILGQDISPYIALVPNVPYLSDFDRHAAYFRHVVNFLSTLQEDFLPHTQTVASVINPFTSISLTESRSLFSELLYWRTLLNMYVPEAESSGKSEDSSLKPLLKTPEAFRVQDWTSANESAYKCEVGRKPNTFDLHGPRRIESTKSSMFAENELNLMTMIRSVIDKATDFLHPPFSILLFEMYLRFEQKNTVGSRENGRVRVEKAKNLLQKNRLRNEMGAYFEISMLEYFEGNKSDAITILLKATNLGCNLLDVDELTGFPNIENQWPIMAELTRMYNRLAEFHFSNDPKVAYNILTLLGSGFKTVDLKSCKKDAKAGSSSANLMLKALRYFEKVMSQIVPGIEDSDIIFPLSKELLGRWDGDKCVEFLAQKTNLIVEWTRGYAMFQFLAKNGDFAAASNVYEKVLERIEITEPLGENGSYDSDTVVRHYVTEQLYIHWCNLGAYVLSKDPMANSKFRSILGRGLQKFPSCPPLLLLFTDVENQMSIAGKLWRMMVGVVKQDGGCNHWAPLFMGVGLAKRIEDLEHDEEIGLSSFGLGGPAVPPDTIFYKLDSLLCAAQENRITRNCPLVWRVHLKLLALRTLQGKDFKRAKATFYEAIRHCPSAKSIYLDGILYFPELLKEATDLMAEKEVHVRMPIEELHVLLELQDEVGAIQSDHSSTSDEDC